MSERGLLSLALVCLLLMGVILLTTGCAPLEPVRKAVADDWQQDCAKRHGRLMRSKSDGAVCVPEDEE